MPLKIYDGTDWIIANTVNTWDGTAWAPAANAYTWDGSAWAQFHPGARLPPPATPPSFTYTAYGIDISNNYAFAKLSVLANGHIQTTSGSTYIPENVTDDATWLITGDNNDYDVRITNVVGNGGILPGSMTPDTIYPLSSTQIFGIEAYSFNAYYVDFNVEILAHTSGTVLANTNVELYVESINPF